MNKLLINLLLIGCLVFVLLAGKFFLGKTKQKGSPHYDFKTQAKDSEKVLKEALPDTDYQVISYQGDSGSMIDIVNGMDHHIMKNGILRVGHQPVTPFVSLRVISDFKAFYDQVAAKNPNQIEKLKGIYGKLAEKYFEFFVAFQQSPKITAVFKDSHKEDLKWFMDAFFSPEMKGMDLSHPMKLYSHLRQKVQQNDLDLVKLIILAKAGVVAAEKADDEILESEFWYILLQGCFPRYWGVLEGLDDEPLGIQATIAFERLFEIANTSFVIDAQSNKIVKAIEFAEAALHKLDGEPQIILKNFLVKIAKDYPEVKNINYTNETDKQKLNKFYVTYQANEKDF